MNKESVGDILKSLGEEDAARIRRLLAGGIRIPVQPRIIEELRRQIQRGELDVRPLSRVITQDPGITGLLFKVVGNRAYRQHQPFDTVEQILHAVGVRQTFNLVQAIALAGAGDLRKNRQVYEAFWARAEAIGQIAMLVADERITVCNIFPDQAYMAGIFLECGVPMLMQRFPSYCAEMRLGTPGVWVDLREEDRKYNTDHCVVGYLVARHWRLPEAICDAVRHYQDLPELGDLAVRSLVAILQLATEIYYREVHVVYPEWNRVRNDVLAELGLADDTLPEFIDVVLERYHENSAV